MVSGEYAFVYSGDSDILVVVIIQFYNILLYSKYHKTNTLSFMTSSNFVNEKAF